MSASDGTALADALRAGIYRLFARTDHLNRINVSPVPDGDTGTNMAMTMSAVLGALGAADAKHAGLLLARIADAAIDGARGNSGAILAQFLLGVADSAEGHATLDAPQFAAAAAAGARYARDAVIEPRDGTLLTVLEAFAVVGVQGSTPSDCAISDTGMTVCLFSMQSRQTGRWATAGTPLVHYRRGMAKLERREENSELSPRPYRPSANARIELSRVGR